MKGKINYTGGEEKYDIHLVEDPFIIRYDAIRGTKVFYVFPYEGKSNTIFEVKEGNLHISRIQSGEYLFYKLDKIEFFNCIPYPKDKIEASITISFQNCEIILLYNLAQVGIIEIYKEHIEYFKKILDLNY